MELPELTVLSQQMDRETSGKQVSEVEVSNPKCLNIPLAQFKGSIIGKTILSVESKGKWLLFRLSSSNTLLFNPGMGADVVHYGKGERLPEKYHVRFALDNDAGFTIRVWWFCYLHLLPNDRLNQHKLTARLGIDPLDEKFTLNEFKRLLAGKRGNIKYFLLDQKNIAGIGNVYVQDMLFNAKVHPKRRIPSFSNVEIEALHKSMRSALRESIKRGGLEHERDFYGTRGAYGMAQFRVAYKPGEPCPNCQTEIQKIKTGSTSSYICPVCQPLNDL
ncbi:MAG: Fpg/Nei family DNA glycosylase [Candidatus Bathyarchaeota archaeon]|nr:Fpg/Nei family DNA glycosylase [Candidatus Bathyarchaeota archaeon]